MGRATREAGLDAAGVLCVVFCRGQPDNGAVADTSGVRVVIYDQVYHVRPGESDPQQVEELARYVDSRMRAIAARTRDVDSLRVAVLTALHIADEFHALQERHDALREAVRDKSAEISSMLEQEIRKAGHPERNAPGGG